MAYAGTTASSSLQNVPRCLLPQMSGPKATSSADSTSVMPRNSNVWFYNTSDATSVMCTPGYFTDGKGLGMRHGDLMMGVSWSSYAATAALSFWGMIGATNSSAGFNLSTDTMLTSSFT